MLHKSYVYILASQRNGTLYTGVTTDLVKRIFEHKNGIIDGFTSRYNVKTLVYFEVFDHLEDALKREKNIKAWKRQWKLNAIEGYNPDWNDLYDDICN